jgi:hypothetical protein
MTVESWQVVEETKYKDYTIVIWHEKYPSEWDNPRTWDNLGHMVCSNRSYAFGDEQFTGQTIDDIREKYGGGISGLEAWAEKERDAAVALPLYLYSHSGQSISTRSFIGRAQHARFDSGLLGVVYVTRDKALKEFDRKRMSQKLRKQIKEIVEAEVETYDQYVQGNVYGFTLRDREGREVETMGGYVGDDFSIMYDEAKSTVDYLEGYRGE